MKKWIGMFAAVTLILLLGAGSIMGLNLSGRAEYGKICSDEEYISQIVRCDGEYYVIYRNADQEKIQIANPGRKYQDYEVLGTVHQDRVYYLFRFQNEAKHAFGIEPVSLSKEEEWQILAFEAEGSFLAAGSTEDEIYVSILGGDGRLVTEYSLSLKEEEPKWRERVSFSVSEEHFVVCGAYDGDQLILVQEDGRVFGRDVVLKEINEKAEDTVLASCFKKELISEADTVWKLNCMKEAVIKLLFPILAGAALIVLLLYGRGQQNHIIYRMISYAGILCLIALTAAGYIFSERLRNQEVMKTGIEAGYLLEEIKSAQRADGTVKSDIYWNAVKETEKLVDDVIIVEPHSSQVILAKTLTPGMDVSEYYGEEISTLAVQVAENNETIMVQLKETGGRQYAVASRNWTQIDADSVLLAVISREGIEGRIETAVSSIWNLIFLLMLGIIIIYMLIFLFFVSQWTRFLEGLQFVAEEKTAYVDKPVKNDGLGGVWSPLDRIGHNIVKLRYERDMLYRSYYRFVPKGMDQLLKKTEVADIEIGDNSQIKGTMVHFQMDSIKNADHDDYRNIMTESLELTHQIRERSDGFFISAGGDLLNRKIFFEKSPKEALRFAVDLYHAHMGKEKLKDANIVMMVHQAEYCYGISGTRDMMTPYIYCADEKILDTYMDALARAKVRVVITENTLRAVESGFSVRYIGFVSGKGQTESIKLYECLDAYAEDKRKRMKNSNTVFQNALRMFYANDFYQARNYFKEVLRMDEQDEIARWYLFHCEYQMNKTEAGVSYGLFENIIKEREDD